MSDDLGPLFDAPPFQAHSPTSIAAAEAIKPHAGTLQLRVLDFLASAGRHGATDEEMQDALAMPANTQRPRRIELLEHGLAVDSRRTRKTRSGREAVVWISVGNVP